MSENNLVAAGHHEAVARNIQFGLTSGDKKQCLIQFRILSGQFEGRSVPWFAYFTEKTWKTTLKGLRSCGWKGDDLATATVENLGNLVELEVEHEKNDKGEMKARVRWVNAPGGGIQLKTPMNEAQMRQFAAQMKSYSSQVPEVEGAPPESTPAASHAAPPAASHEPPPIEGNPDDDIPF